MISLQRLFQKVNFDLARKGKGGYQSNDEFNRTVALAQHDLMSAYIKKFDAEKEVNDALIPFIKEAYPAATNSIVPYPDDYRHLMELGRGKIAGDDCDSEFEYYPSLPMKANNKLLVMTSQVRKPDASKNSFWHEFLSAGIRVHPTSYTGNVYLKYIAQPDEATRAVTIVGDEEQYDAGSTVDLVWPEQEETRFVELLLYYKMVEIRDPLLVEFFQLKPVI